VGWWKYVVDISTGGFNAKAQRREDAKERSKRARRESCEGLRVCGRKESFKVE